MKKRLYKSQSNIMFDGVCGGIAEYFDIDPSLVAVLSWLPARYFGVLMGWEDAVVGGRTMMLAGVFMVVTYAMNALAPKLAGKFAVSTTIIKLIPLLLMAIVGTIVGLTNGMTSNFHKKGDEKWVSKLLDRLFSEWNTKRKKAKLPIIKREDVAFMADVVQMLKGAESANL